MLQNHTISLPSSSEPGLASIPISYFSSIHIEGRMPKSCQKPKLKSETQPEIPTHQSNTRQSVVVSAIRFHLMLGNRAFSQAFFLPKAIDSDPFVSEIQENFLS